MKAHNKLAATTYNVSVYLELLLTSVDFHNGGHKGMPQKFPEMIIEHHSWEMGY